MSAQRSLQQNSWLNRVTIWREMDGEAPGITGSIPFFSSCGCCCGWEHMTCSVNWWKSVLKQWIYTEHLDICCSSHFNLLKQSTFWQCNQDVLPMRQGYVGPWLIADVHLTLVKKMCWWESVWVIKQFFAVSYHVKGKGHVCVESGDVRAPATQLKTPDFCSPRDWVFCYTSDVGTNDFRVRSQFLLYK